MYLSPNEDERLVIDATAQAVAAEAPLERWFLPDTNAAVEEARVSRMGARLGWTSMTAQGDATVVDETLLFRELGRRLAPVGLTASTIGALVALGAGQRALSEVLLSGEPVALLAKAGAAGTMLLGSSGAAYALAVSGHRLEIMHLAAQEEPTASLDWTTTTARLAANSGTLLANVESAELAGRFSLLIAAQNQAISELALSESVGYAKLREQFGRPIGSFQAIRHKCVDMAVRAERSRAQLFLAAVAHRDGHADGAFQAQCASVLAQDAAKANALANIFIHGAMGVTAENAGHLLLKRSLLWAFVLEPVAATLERLAAAPISVGKAA